MIRRINKLKNLGRFVDLRSPGGNQNEFVRLNVVYALNGCGKTTLCDVFRSLGSRNKDFILGRKRFGATGDTEIEFLFEGTPAPLVTFQSGDWKPSLPGTSQKKILVYDDRFVTDNVLVGHAIPVEQRRNLYGLALGAQAVVLARNVEIAEKALADATAAFNTAKKVITALVPSGYTLETYRNLAADDAIDEKIKAAREEWETAKRQQQNAESIRRHRPLEVVQVANLPSSISEVLGSTLESVALKSEGQIREHLRAHSKGLTLEWAGQGIRSQSGSMCPLCGQLMQPDGILAAYRAFFSGALREQQVAQTRLAKEVEQRFGSAARKHLARVMGSHITEAQWWREVGGLAFELPKDTKIEFFVNAMDQVHSVLVYALQRKRENPSDPVLLNTDENLALAKWTAIAPVIEKYMAIISETRRSITKFQQGLGTKNIAPLERRIAPLEAQKRRQASNVIDAFTAYDRAEKDRAEKEKAKAAANDALRSQANKVLEDYGDRINRLLQLFNVDFRLVSTGVNFLGGPPAGELAIQIDGTKVSTSQEDSRNPSRPSLANTLSGGDRSALGFAFFIAMAESEPELAETIVVFDDPFHSQDRSRRRRTIECVHRVAGAACQAFVLSHELDFAHEVADAPSLAVRRFTMDRLSNHTVLGSCDFPPLASRSYEQDYAKLEGYLKDPGKFSSQLKDVARSIRQTLECYLRTKYPSCWGEKEWLGDMIGKIRIAQLGQPLYGIFHLLNDLTQVNDWGKRFYHGETDGSVAGSIDPNELRGYVIQTLSIISK